MHGLHLAHDVLDAQLVDRRHEKIGRVDTMVLELCEGRPPRVAAVLVGGEVRAMRAGRWMQWLHRVWHSLLRSPATSASRISFCAVRCIADTVEVDVDGRELPSGHVERWLAEHIVCRIPGATGKAYE
jgi:hypothetical protein